MRKWNFHRNLFYWIGLESWIKAHLLSLPLFNSTVDKIVLSSLLHLEVWITWLDKRQKPVVTVIGLYFKWTTRGIESREYLPPKLENQTGWRGRLHMPRVAFIINYGICTSTYTLNVSRRLFGWSWMNLLIMQLSAIGPYPHKEIHFLS